MASETPSIGLVSGQIGRLVALNRSDRYTMLSAVGRGGHDWDVKCYWFPFRQKCCKFDSEKIDAGNDHLGELHTIQIIDSFFVSRSTFRFHVQIGFLIVPGLIVILLEIHLFIPLPSGWVVRFYYRFTAPLLTPPHPTPNANDTTYPRRLKRTDTDRTYPRHLELQVASPAHPKCTPVFLGIVTLRQDQTPSPFLHPRQLEPQVASAANHKCTPIFFSGLFSQDQTFPSPTPTVGAPGLHPKSPPSFLG